MDINASLQKWYKLHLQLKKIKTEEAAARREICSGFLKDDIPPITKKVQTELYNVEAKFNVSHKFDEPVLNQIWPELDDNEKNAVKFKPSVVISVYKKLPEDSLLHEAVTITPSMPTLKLEEL